MIIRMMLAGVFLVSHLEAQDKSSQRKHTEVRVPASGKTEKAFQPLDQMMTKLVGEQDIPGASLAVSKDGKVVYSRGFGLRDREKGLPVLPATRFRIASLSKPITAAAIMLLVNEGRLKLDDPFVSHLNKSLVKSVAKQIDQITVRQLLNHRGGWDRDKSFDPMFRTVEIGKSLGLKRPANQAEIISYMLSQPLDFRPGQRYAYSNFGYCLLGRIIEEKSGMSYERFVTQNLFQPIDAQSFKLGKSLVTLPRESVYYSRKPRWADGIVPGAMGRKTLRQYGGWNLEIMDSHGGWIASAEDLVKFSNMFDDSKYGLDPLIIFAPDESDKEKTVYYGMGWQVRRLGKSGKINSWHTGGLTATSTLLVRRHDGFAWAVLFNSRTAKNGKSLAGIVDPLVHQAVNQVKNWPTP